MKGIIKTAVALALAAALVAPAVASAGSAGDALAQERYYSSYGKPAALQPARTVTVETNDPGAWKLVAIGSGALVLVLGALELATLARMRGVRAA